MDCRSGKIEVNITTQVYAVTFISRLDFTTFLSETEKRFILRQAYMTFLNDLPNSSPMTLHNVSKCPAHASPGPGKTTASPSRAMRAIANRHFLINVAAVSCFLQSSRYFYLRK